MEDGKQILELVFTASPAIRYAALYRDGSLASSQRRGVSDPSSAESDRYEEILVNPTLLMLARQRADIDCGGLRFLVVGYAHFHQILLPLANGHLSICVELQADPLAVRDSVLQTFADNSTVLRLR